MSYFEPRNAGFLMSPADQEKAVLKSLSNPPKAIEAKDVNGLWWMIGLLVPEFVVDVVDFILGIKPEFPVKIYLAEKVGPLIHEYRCDEPGNQEEEGVLVFGSYSLEWGIGTRTCYGVPVAAPAAIYDLDEGTALVYYRIRRGGEERTAVLYVNP